MDRVWVGHCFKNLDPDEVGQDAGPQGVAFPDSVLGSLGLARLGDVTEMVQTFTWPMPHIFLKEIFSQIRSVAQSCPTPCDPMNRSTPGLPVHHQLPEFTQTHVHRVSDAIQPSHPLSSPSPPVPNPSQHQSLFQ